MGGPQSANVWKTAFVACCGRLQMHFMPDRKRENRSNWSDQE